MKIERVKVSDLLPDPSNARQHSTKNLDAIKASLLKFSQQKPIVINKEGIVIAGNGTLIAAKELGWSEIKCVRSELGKVEQTAYAVADNRSAELASWDMDVLGDTLQSLREDDWDLEDLGFDVGDLEEFDFDDETSGNAGLTDPDEVPEVTGNEFNVERGQIWKLGDHILMCGDSTCKEDVERLMAGEKADMVFTDPPYNHASSEKLVSQSISKAMKKLSESEWDKNFCFENTARIIDQFLSENSTVYVCTSWHLAGEIWSWMKEHSNCSGYCVWHKTNPQPSLSKRHWTWSTELICYATYGKHIFNFPKDGHALNVWNFPKTHHTDFQGHVAQKPIAVCEHAILHSSNINSLVLDLFLGSGSTLIACEKTGRRCFGMEVDEHYCSVIIKRWQDFSGNKAELLNG